ncbi:hypothetical protein PWG71_14435 [Nocardiopsis sp. N85]|uniref:DUF7144 family membrane protein n=1 Tax=Nocardiopsis sp. N85 TaxID=3029400 RepID=UPI00237EF1D2|nr:hypothetical protein [Nocardiopsis sp. N85]MDE3722586.1 hypothetical protein [Nocardiopsis sp. N85]
MRVDSANGWQYFVATLLIVIGLVNVIQGMVALFTPEYYVVGSSEMLVMAYDSWGVLLGLWGAVLVVAGLAVLSGSTWARVFAIVLACLNALAQMAFVMAMPLWSMMAIAIDLLVIFGLTAGWPDRNRAEGGGTSPRTATDESVYRSGHRAAHEAPRPARSPEQTTEHGQTTG